MVFGDSGQLADVKLASMHSDQDPLVTTCLASVRYFALTVLVYIGAISHTMGTLCGSEEKLFLVCVMTPYCYVLFTGLTGFTFGAVLATALSGLYMSVKAPFCFWGVIQMYLPLW